MMSSPIITSLEDLAFEEILRSVYETLKIECRGSLFGVSNESKTKTTFHVESAHAIQLALRYPNSVIPQEGSLRVDWSLQSDCIGGYHLHPYGRQQKDYCLRTKQGKVYVSKTDKKGLREEQGKIEIVTTLNPVKRKTKLSENPFLVSGFIDDDGKSYKFEMGSYIYTNRLRRCEMKVSSRALKLVR